MKLTYLGAISYTMINKPIQSAIRYELEPHSSQLIQPIENDDNL